MKLVRKIGWAPLAGIAVLIEIAIILFLSGFAAGEALFAVISAFSGVALVALVLFAWMGERRALREYWQSGSHDPVADEAAPLSEFEQMVQRALDDLPDELRDAMSNVEVVVEDEPPQRHVLGLYRGVPLTRRNSAYALALPDKISIYRGPLERLYGGDPGLLESQVRRTVLHEIAHHFGISDARLIEIDRY
jgi:predicted Zn-dependent protease with MMP-like domain